MGSAYHSLRSRRCYSCQACDYCCCYHCAAKVYVRVAVHFVYTIYVHDTHMYRYRYRCMCMYVGTHVGVYVCMHIRICMSVCLSVCLPGWLSVCLSVCLPVRLSVRRSVGLSPNYTPTVKPSFFAPVSSAFNHPMLLLLLFFNWTLCERAQHLAGDCRDVHSLWCETGSVIYSWPKEKLRICIN